MADRKPFFAAVRQKPFGGSLLQTHVDGLNVILDEWERRKFTDLRWLAYILATTFHETARTMQPIAEYGKGKGREYGKPDPQTGKTYYGRGYVQLTWKTNYETFSKRYGIDLVNNPDLALRPDIAVRILFDGMIVGIYTGKKLGDYFTDTMTDWRNARRIVNGTDKADLIAGYALDFLTALQRLPAPSVPPDAPEPAPAPPEPPVAPAKGFIAVLLDTILSIFRKDTK